MGAPPKKKRHHYVPQFVLRNFSPDGRSGSTFVLETGELHANASVRGQCAKDYFYGRDPDMENAFAESETKVAATLRQVASGDLSTFVGEYRTREFPDSTAELDVLRAHPLYALREYGFYQTHRTAASAESIEDEFDAEMKRLFRKNPWFREKSPEAYKWLDHIIIKPTGTMGHILYTAGPLSFAMLDMTVKFLVADKPSFILSDHPVMLRNQYAELNPSGPGALGMLARGLQMFMPVSPTMTIAIYDGDIYECGADDKVIVKLSARNAQVLNAMQVRNANECIFLHPDATVDHDELRRTWQNRPEILPPPHLRCFQIHDRTTEEARSKFGDMTSFPIRSLALATAVEDLAAVMDWRVKEAVITRGLPVAPEWKEWLDSIEDPRKPPMSHGRR